MLSWLAAPAALLLLVSSAPREGGLFSTRAVSVGDNFTWIEGPGGLMRGSFRARSPDGRSTLTVSMEERGSEKGGDFRHVSHLVLAGAAGNVRYSAGGGYLGDVLWSRDSRRVAISLSGGGSGGTYDLYVADSRGVRRISDRFQRALNPPLSCDLRDHSNVGAVEWLSSSRLLVAARQSHLDSCPQANRTKLYVYDLGRGAMVETLTRAQARRRFPGAMGYLLAD